MKVCRKCGMMIDIITLGVYRKVLVDAVPYYVKADPEGEEFIRFDGKDGSKMKAREVPFMEDGAETAYKPHRCGR